VKKESQYLQKNLPPEKAIHLEGVLV